MEGNKKISKKWVVYWSEYAKDTYLYGSKIKFHKKSVEFENKMMPPGTVIKEWYSKTNFQAQQIEPTLPIIDGESSYRITVNMEVPKGEQCIVRLVFLDRYDVEAQSLSIREKTMEFRCPLKTYSYKLQIINAGVKSFRFNSVIIEELSGEDEE